MKDDVEKLNLIRQIEDLTKQKQFLQDKCRQAGKDIKELKRDNTLLSYDVATLTDRIKEMENHAKR